MSSLEASVASAALDFVLTLSGASLQHRAEVVHSIKRWVVRQFIRWNDQRRRATVDIMTFMPQQ